MFKNVAPLLGVGEKDKQKKINHPTTIGKYSKEDHLGWRRRFQAAQSGIVNTIRLGIIDTNMSVATSVVNVLITLKHVTVY